MSHAKQIEVILGCVLGYADALDDMGLISDDDYDKITEAVTILTTIADKSLKEMEE